MKSMNDLVLHFLQDIYYAEKAGVRGMAKMAKAVENADLKQAILEHRDQSQQHLSRLEQVFETLGKRARGKACAAMNGLLEEADEAAEDGDKGPVLDAALIACAQAVDHYEIARYGALVAWARQSGNDEAAEILQGILDEEKENDSRLNEIAETAANKQAAESGEEDEDDGEGEDEEPEGEEGEDEEQGAKPARGGRRAAASRKPAAKPTRAPAKKPATAAGGRRGSSRGKA